MFPASLHGRQVAHFSPDRFAHTSALLLVVCYRSGYSGGYDDARGYGSYGPERGGSRGYGAPRSGPYDRR
jgi:hypothetical protein